ncbi:unnamed protein product, partial [Symbiodinium microadriaticum]
PLGHPPKTVGSTRRSSPGKPDQHKTLATKDRTPPAVGDLAHVRLRLVEPEPFDCRASTSLSKPTLPKPRSLYQPAKSGMLGPSPPPVQALLASPEPAQKQYGGLKIKPKSLFGKRKKINKKQQPEDIKTKNANFKKHKIQYAPITAQKQSVGLKELDSEISYPEIAHFTDDLGCRR